jgi:putative membrane protein
MLIKGILLGFIMVLPGMSGGTMFVIFGIYEQLVKDLARLKVKPYLPLLGGILIGIFLSGSLFSHFFEVYRNETAVFLMGCLLASIRAVLRCCPDLTAGRIVFFGAGGIAGFALGADPIGIVSSVEEVSILYLLIGSALASATMVLPGLPGSSVLIAMGIYDTVLFYLSDLVISRLLILGAGSLLGIFLLVNILEKFYDRYRGLISYFFAGLILGSARALIPTDFNFLILFLFIAGFSIVWIWSGKS